MTHPAFFIFYYNLPTNYCCSPRGEQPDRLLNGNLTLLFQSTPSLRRATYCDSSQWTTLGISIHALLAESDLYKCPSPDRSKYFNPRSPCGERPFCANELLSIVEFQSTLSLRRATYGAGRKDAIFQNFNPRSPCGERLVRRPSSKSSIQISIHALLAESDSVLLYSHNHL